MTSSAAKQAHTLVSYFSKKYKEKYGYAPRTNRYKARWGFDTIIMDMTVDEVKALLDYYLTTISPNGHDLEWFFYNYDKLAVAMEKFKKDRDELAIIRERTRKRTEEWRKKKSVED